MKLEFLTSQTRNKGASEVSRQGRGTNSAFFRGEGGGDGPLAESLLYGYTRRQSENVGQTIMMASSSTDEKCIFTLLFYEQSAVCGLPFVLSY